MLVISPMNGHYVMNGHLLINTSDGPDKCDTYKLTAIVVHV